MNGGGGEAGREEKSSASCNPPYMVYLPGVQNFSLVPHIINGIFYLLIYFMIISVAPTFSFT